MTFLFQFCDAYAACRSRQRRTSVSVLTVGAWHQERLGIRKDKVARPPPRHDDAVPPIRSKGVATDPIAKTRKPSRIRARDLSQAFMWSTSSLIGCRNITVTRDSYGWRGELMRVERGLVNHAVFAKGFAFILGDCACGDRRSKRGLGRSTTQRRVVRAGRSPGPCWSTSRRRR